VYVWLCAKTCIYACSYVYVFGSRWALAKYFNLWVTQIEIYWVLSCIFVLTICLFSELRHAIVHARLVYIHKALWSTIWRLFTRTSEFCVLLLTFIVAHRKRKIMNYASVENPGHIMWTLRKVVIRTTSKILKRGIPWLHWNLSIVYVLPRNLVVALFFVIVATV
jgi:hypothetical protein